MRGTGSIPSEGGGGRGVSHLKGERKVGVGVGEHPITGVEDGFPPEWKEGTIPKGTARRGVPIRGWKASRAGEEGSFSL